MMMMLAARSSLLNGLNAYWNLNESSTGVADVLRIDSVGGLVLTDTTHVPSAAGQVGNCAAFAFSKYLTIADAPALNPTGDFTLAAWFALPITTARQAIVAKGTIAAATCQYVLFFHEAATNRIKFVVSNGTTTYTAIANTFGVPNTAFHLAVCSYISATGKIQIQIDNGAKDEVDSFTGGVPATAQTFNVGALAGGGNSGDQKVDEVGLWSRNLTTAERTALYNGGSGITYPFDGLSVLSRTYLYSSSIEA